MLNANDTYINEDKHNINNTLNKKIFDDLYHSTQLDALDKVKFFYNKTFGYFYTDLLYLNLFINIKNNYSYFFITSLPLLNFQKYISRKIKHIYMEIIHKTLQNHDKDNQYIFIDNFYYLEKDTTSGYSNINNFF